MRQIVVWFELFLREILSVWDTAFGYNWERSDEPGHARAVDAWSFGRCPVCAQFDRGTGKKRAGQEFHTKIK
jgi:hypothetical protein